MTPYQRLHAEASLRDQPVHPAHSTAPQGGIGIDLDLACGCSDPGKCPCRCHAEAFAQEVSRIHAAVSSMDPDGPGITVDEATQTVTLANGAIRAVGLPMVRWLADRLDSIDLKAKTRMFGHSGQ